MVAMLKDRCPSLKTLVVRANQRGFDDIIQGQWSRLEGVHLLLSHRVDAQQIHDFLDKHRSTLRHAKILAGNASVSQFVALSHLRTLCVASSNPTLQVDGGQWQSLQFIGGILLDLNTADKLNRAAPNLRDMSVAGDASFLDYKGQFIFVDRLEIGFPSLVLLLVRFCFSSFFLS